MFKLCLSLLSLLVLIAGGQPSFAAQINQAYRGLCTGLVEATVKGSGIPTQGMMTLTLIAALCLFAFWLFGRSGHRRVFPGIVLRKRLSVPSVLVALAVMFLSTSAAHATDYRWGGRYSDDWSRADNWSPAGVPGVNDSATIESGNPHRPVIRSAVTLRDLTIRGYGGQLTGGSITVSGTLTLEGGSIYGTRVIANGSVAINRGPDTNTLGDVCVFTNIGTANLNSAVLHLSRSAIFSNVGTFNMRGNAQLSSDGSSLFTNHGMFVKPDSGRASLASVVRSPAFFSNEGTVQVPVSDPPATLSFFRMGVRNERTFDVGTGQQIQIVDSDLDLFGSITGGGLTAISGAGTVTLHTDISATNVSFSAREMVGEGTLDISGHFTWGAGTIRGQHTVLNIAKDATLFLVRSPEPSATQKSLESGARIDNRGTAVWEGGSISGANATLVNHEGAIFNTQTDADLEGTASFYNNGIFSKSVATGVTSIAWRFENNGIVRTDSGTISFPGRGEQGLRNGGMLLANSINSIIRLRGEASFFDSTIILGEGIISVDNNAIITLVTGFIPVSVRIFDLSGYPTLRGPGEIRFGGRVIWGRARMEGGGTATINPGGTLDITGIDPTLNGFTINNGGNAFIGTTNPNSPGVILTGPNGGIFFNLGDFTNKGFATVFTLGTPSNFNNSGTIYPGWPPQVKSPAPYGALSTNDKEAFLIDGVPEAVPGILRINGTYEQTDSGTLNIQIGGTEPGPSPPGPEFDQLKVNGTAFLDGTLNVSLVNDFEPEPGDTFRVLTFSGREGEFTAYNLPELPEGLVWEVAWGDTYLDLNVLVQSGSLRSNR